MTKADTHNVIGRSKLLKNICTVISFYKFQKHAKLNNSLRIQTIWFKYEENTKRRLPLKWEDRMVEFTAMEQNKEKRTKTA